MIELSGILAYKSIRSKNITVYSLHSPQFTTCNLFGVRLTLTFSLLLDFLALYVLMLSDTTSMIGGETYIKRGDGRLMKIEGPSFVPSFKTGLASCRFTNKRGLASHH
ncbi:hypothetical protein V8E54_014266 [Elaphomyces granulatus]